MTPKPDQLSPHFNRAEFRCQCGCGWSEPAPALIAGLELLRHAIGDKPIKIISGCRCAKHNSDVGGGARSQHLQGKAADIYVKGMTPRELYAVAKTIPQLRGFGVNDAGGTLHVDVRLATARWCYLNGKQSPWRDA